MSGPLLRAGLPRAEPGMVIGLLGGSFDPAHEGHVAITKAALRSFGLDRVWWLVSPGNPLKAKGPAPLDRRIKAAQRVMNDPRVIITGIEARLNTRYTADTLRALRKAYPDVRFVWLMGSDNLASFHLWRDWKTIAANHPLGVLARPGSRLSSQFSPSARAMATAKLPAERAQYLGKTRAPAWCMVNLPLSSASSTAIRASGGWTR